MVQLTKYFFVSFQANVSLATAFLYISQEYFYSDLEETDPPDISLLPAALLDPAPLAGSLPVLPVGCCYSALFPADLPLGWGKPGKRMLWSCIQRHDSVAGVDPWVYCWWRTTQGGAS